MMKRAAQSGQILAGVIVVLLIMSILVPLMVMYTQREAIWTNKQARSATAFHLAESGIEKGLLAISVSTGTWVALMNGTPVSGFTGATAYSDVPGGRYSVSITSGPLSDQATIISIGRDSAGKEVRALRAVYSNSTLGGITVFGSGGVQISGGVNVEWGAVVSPGNVEAGGRLSPQFWAAGSIGGYDTNPDPPNCDGPDCCQWHAYSSQIPPQPPIDLNFYRDSATATSTYWNTPQTWKGYTSLTGKAHFVENNLTLDAPGIDVVGSVIVTGNMDTGSGAWGTGTRNMEMPRDAWKQYCRNWAYFKSTFCNAAPCSTSVPASFPGLDSAYLSPSGTMYNSKKIAVDGLLYVGGTLNSGGGGGQGDVYGVFLVVGTSTMTNNSGVTLYYNKGAAQALQTTKITLSRVSWREEVRQWPTGL